MWNNSVGAGIENKARYDHVFIALCVLLMGIGLVTLYSASYAFAGRWFNDKLFFLKRQALFAALSFLLFFFASRIKIETVKKFVMPLVLGAAFLCIVLFIPGIGTTKNGATRWIDLGPLTIQPSELVKIVLPLYLAYIFDKKKDKLDDFRSGVLPPVIVTIVFFALIYFQNDFSTALFIALNSLVIFFIAGVKLRYFICAVVILIPVSALLIMTKEYRLLRFISFFDPAFDVSGAGFQVDNSTRAIASGGFWGKGIGQGVLKIASVPEIQSDFIFASFAEETGFIGVFLFMASFVFFALRGYKIALGSSDTFNKLLSFALVTIIVSQVVMNIAVVSGAIPATGIPLPFFSAGGTSLVITFIASGLVANISRG
ncbi:MAG: putative lipid II flippase FtsW, partial [Spirochaetaceae bacterium]|nr:putative lipid II flippase FtsW [Spirochaetaceae bacterium]